MLGRRFSYLAVLLLSFIFFCFYKEWFSWLMLMAVLFLPLLSLLLSLPAMVTTRVFLVCPEQVRSDVPARIALRCSCRLPAPPVRSKVVLENHLTGQRYTGLPGEHVPTGHCGLVTVHCKGLRLYDYLGLIGFPLKGKRECQVCVLPRPIPGAVPPPAREQVVTNWKPKPGGGFAENHDLRLYRPGDDLRHIHWKLSAKTGQLIYREAMEPVQKAYLLQLTLFGTPEELDRKLGRLLWLSQTLLAQNQPHVIHCQTGSGMLRLEVTDVATQEAALRTILAGTPADSEVRPGKKEALWQCYIGGGQDA